MPTHNKDLNVLLSHRLTYHECDPDISAFKLSCSVASPEDAPAWVKHVLAKAVHAGLAHTTDIQKFLAGEAETLVADPQLHLVSPTYLSQVQAYGYAPAFDDLGLLANFATDADDRLTVPADWQVVRDDVSSHMLFDVAGNPLPIGLLHSYLAGEIRDGAYDIDKLVARLNEHPQVRPPKHSPHTQLIAEFVPYYNAEPGWTTCTSFVFTPSQEQMQQLWAMAKIINGAHPSTALHQAVFTLDLMGLRAAGIALSDNYCVG